MPFPADDKLIALSEAVIAQFDAIFGLHPGFRPAHAKGLLLEGVFHPSAAAATLSKAPHFTKQATPIYVRFSNSTGLPLIPDNDGNADPRGMAIRFRLSEHHHTDIIAHSADGFPARTGEEFLEFLGALAKGPGPGSALEQFLGSHEAARRFVQTPKPAPVSFATEPYFGVSALHFTNASGETHFGRYRILPCLPEARLTAAEVALKSANYLFDELEQTLSTSSVRFTLQVQLAEAGDIVDDATIHWPEDRALLNVGTLEITSVAAENAAQQKQMIFDPIPRIDGIEPSADPLLELRAALYLISGRRRRAAH